MLSIDAYQAGCGVSALKSSAILNMRHLSGELYTELVIAHVAFQEAGEDVIVNLGSRSRETWVYLLLLPAWGSSQTSASLYSQGNNGACLLHLFGGI